MSENGSGEQSDGSVGRYVRERWGAADSAGRSFGRRRRGGGDDPPQQDDGPPERGPSAAERAPAPGRASVGTQTPPSGSAWGSELPEIDDDLVDEIDPSTPPRGLDLSARRSASDISRDHGPDDTGLYRAGGDSAPEPRREDSGGYEDDPDAAVIWRRPDVGGEEHAGDHDDSTAARPGSADATAGHGATDQTAPLPARAAADTSERPASLRAGATPGRPNAVDRGADRLTGERPDRDRASADRAAGRGRSTAAASGRSRPADSGGRRPRWTAPQAVEARSAQHRRGGEDAHAGGLDLAPSRTLPGRRPSSSGWRRLVYVLSGGLINPGESPAEIYRNDLENRVKRPLTTSHKIAMLSLKGGVGKTTVTTTLGATFASHRGDRVVAVDANPDRGTLSQKVPLETTATVRHLLRDADKVRRYSDVRAYTSQGISRLEVLASEQDPAVSEAFSEDDYRRAVDLLEHFYNLVLTDCGTGLMHSAMYGVLGLADQIVIVSSGSIDGARSASATLDWLDAHGYGSLVRNAVVVINSVYRRAGGVDLDRVAEHFAGRCRAVVRVPFDSHLEEGAEIDLDRLEEPTRVALLELAAAVADGFPV